MADIIKFKNADENQKEVRKEALLEVVDEMRSQIEQGYILELVACSLDDEGECQIHVYVGDKAAGVGLYEIGKHILLNQFDYED